LSSTCSRDEKTNSGESNLVRCERNSGRHGAGPTLEGVVAEVDIVRAMPRRRVAAEEAMVKDVLVSIDVFLGFHIDLRRDERQRWMC